MKKTIGDQFLCEVEISTESAQEKNIRTMMMHIYIYRYYIHVCTLICIYIYIRIYNVPVLLILSSIISWGSQIRFPTVQLESVISEVSRLWYHHTVAPSEFFFDRGPLPQGPRGKQLAPESHPRSPLPMIQEFPNIKWWFFFGGGLLWYVLGQMLEMFQRWIATNLATQNHVISKIVCVKAAFWL